MAYSHIHAKGCLLFGRVNSLYYWDKNSKFSFWDLCPKMLGYVLHNFEGSSLILQDILLTCGSALLASDRFEFHFQ